MSRELPALLPSAPPWTEQDASWLRDQLKTVPCQRLLQQLVYLRPSVTSTERELRNIQTDQRAGYEAAISDILNLSDPTISR